MSDRSQKFVRAAHPLVCLTAYTKPMAAAVAPHVDLILVGDSVAMTVYGMENTIGANVAMMVAHGQAVRRGAPDTLIVVDMPHGSYEHSDADALKNARQIMDETGCDAVKLEGGADMASRVKTLIDNNIPVMGHIGLLPQSVEKEGGYKIKGKSEDDIARLINDARAIEQAGAFSIVIEGTIHDAAEQITNAVTIPTIGIGASPACSGQILVCDDMLGLTVGHVPKFVKQYAQIGEDIGSAVEAYAEEVRTRAFPAAEHLYQLKAKAS